MSDADNRPRLRRCEGSETIVFHHPCHVDGCSERGIFGEGVSLRSGKPGVWSCGDHSAAAQRLQSEQRTRDAAAEARRASAIAAGAGDLF